MLPQSKVVVGQQITRISQETDRNLWARDQTEVRIIYLWWNNRSYINFDMNNLS
jgi:hypothetical protein